jgi:hypothetical protein
MYGDADLSVEGAGESIRLVGVADLVYKIVGIVDQTKGSRNMYQI